MDLPLDGTEPVDVIIEKYPATSMWLYKRGIICVQCGEVFWGSLCELCRQRGVAEEEFTELLQSINEYLQENMPGGNSGAVPPR